MHDEEIVELLCAGDSRGLAELLSRYGGVVKGMLAKNFGDDLDHLERAEVLNEAVTNVWRWAGSYSADRGALHSWFCQIVVNVARRTLQSKRRHPSAGLEEHSVSYGTPERLSNPDSRLLSHLERCIASLPGLQRDVIRADLEAVDGAANAKDLAAMLGTTVSTIYVTRNRARKALRECMGKRGYGF